MTTANPETGRNEVRQRDYELMDRLADIILKRAYPCPEGAPEELRQLGYAAFLVAFSVPENPESMDTLVAHCKQFIPEIPDGSIVPRDPVHGMWGARCPLYARKIRTELPMHILRKRMGADWRQGA